MTWTLHQGDCVEVMREMESNSVDAVVTDHDSLSTFPFSALCLTGRILVCDNERGAER